MSLVPFDDRDGWIWLDGAFVPWREAKVHVLTHGLHYASGVFEGERMYGGEIFKLTEHTQRLFKSAEILDFSIPYSVAEIDEACKAVCAANHLTDCYVRPIAWRGSIEPTNPSAWFRSYRRLLLPYAAVAASGHAATLVVGTELESLEGDPHWPALIRAVRSVYPGQLLYDENFDEFAQHDANLPLSTFGVDAYPRFQLPDTATVGQLTQAWENWLGAHALSVRESVVLSEVGIDAVAGSYPDPGAWLGTTQSPIDTTVQTNWYKAVCRAVSAEQVGGIYWWEVSFDANPADPGPFQSDRITFLDRPAQQVIKDCFAKLASGQIGPANAGA